jgi:hypothetical protein
MPRSRPAGADRACQDASCIVRRERDVKLFACGVENRLISVDSGSTATYAYHPHGQRVQKVSNVGSGGDPVGT